MTTNPRPAHVYVIEWRPGTHGAYYPTPNVMLWAARLGPAAYVTLDHVPGGAVRVHAITLAPWDTLRGMVARELRRAAAPSAVVTRDGGSPRIVSADGACRPFGCPDTTPTPEATP